MRRELVFNDLCSQVKVSSQYEANKVIEGFLNTIKISFQFGFKKVQVESGFRLYILFDNYSIEDWLSSNNINQTKKSFLLSSIIHPYINDKEDEVIHDDFIKFKYKFDETHSLNGQISIGLSIAYLFQKKNYIVLGISFLNDVVFDNINLKLLQENNNVWKEVLVKHIAKPDHINSHLDWINSIDIVLIESSLLPESKKISIRHDHGKDILMEFAKKIVKSPYVIEIINSLPFNRRLNRFIKEVRQDGIIEIVLYNEDDGYGLVIKTTGRNISETKRIANIIQNEFYN